MYKCRIILRHSSLVAISNGDGGGFGHILVGISPGYKGIDKQIPGRDPGEEPVEIVEPTTV